MSLRKTASYRETVQRYAKYRRGQSPKKFYIPATRFFSAVCQLNKTSPLATGHNTMFRPTGTLAQPNRCLQRADTGKTSSPTLFPKRKPRSICDQFAYFAPNNQSNKTRNMAEKKYYVVWEGVTPGVYDTWAECQLQTKGYKGAVFKSFKTRSEAEAAFASHPSAFVGEAGKRKEAQTPRVAPSAIDSNGIAVDAACSGNPGRMEYRGVHIASGQELFHFGPILATNNIGEFLAIVHGLAYIKQHAYTMPLYSDSRNAMLWVAQKKCKTKLARCAETEKAFELIERAEKWLTQNTYSTPIIKWETGEWGEIPADFGRK